MRLLLLLLSSQISAELMRLQCEFEFKPIDEEPFTAMKVYTFDKNQGEIADIEMYNRSGKMFKRLLGAKINWSPSSITIKYEEEGLIWPVEFTDIINRQDLSYSTSAIHGNEDWRWDYYGECVSVVTQNNF